MKNGMELGKIKKIVQVVLPFLLSHEINSCKNLIFIKEK